MGVLIYPLQDTGSFFRPPHVHAHVCTHAHTHPSLLCTLHKFLMAHFSCCTVSTEILGFSVRSELPNGQGCFTWWHQLRAAWALSPQSMNEWTQYHPQKLPWLWRHQTSVIKDTPASFPTAELWIYNSSAYLYHFPHMHYISLNIMLISCGLELLHATRIITHFSTPYFSHMTLSREP